MQIDLHLDRSRIHRTSSPLRREGTGQRSGFTIIELLAVIGIMIVLLSFTIPVLRSSGSGGVNKAAWEIAGVIEQGQAYALAQNTYVWIALNEATVSTANDKRVATFAIASRDGSSAHSDAANLVLIDQIRGFEGVSMAPSTNKFGPDANGYGKRPTTNLQVIGTTAGNVTLATASLPRRSFSGTSYTLANAGNCVIQIDPSGSITFPGSTGANHWLELRLQAVRGVAEIEGDTAVLQVSTLTGRPQIYRPGSQSPTDQP